eukprot:scaffold3190_cov409-Prasinococcus_capsulatus_cf.AAC.2
MAFLHRLHLLVQCATLAEGSSYSLAEAVDKGPGNSAAHLHPSIFLHSNVIRPAPRPEHRNAGPSGAARVKGGLKFIYVTEASPFPMAQLIRSIPAQRRVTFIDPNTLPARTAEEPMRGSILPVEVLTATIRSLG